MNTQEALLQAIWNDPDDDTPRLVYADFLEETGREEEVARAKFIRLGIETAKLDPIEKHWNPLFAEEKRLWKKYRTRWMAGLPRWAYHAPPERGFLHETYSAIHIHQFRKEAEAIFHREPLIQLALMGGSREEAKRLAESSILSRVRFLKLFGYLVDKEQLELLFQSPHLKNLWGFEVWGNPPETDLISLITGQEKFSTFRRLHFNWQPIGIAGVSALSQSSTLKELVSFGLHADASPESAKLLTTSPMMNKVRSFRFTGDFQISVLGAKGFRVLTKSPWMNQLESLDLMGNRITNDGLKNLPRSQTWDRLEVLNLFGNEIGDDGLKSLAQKSLPKIRILDLQCNPIIGHGLAELLQSTAGKSLEQLFLANCSIDDEGLSAIAQSIATGSLLFLQLNYNRFSGKGLKALVNSPFVQNLRVLELNLVAIGSLGATAIAESPYLTKLDTLELTDCQITYQGLLALSRSANCASLRTLNLSANRFTPKGIQALAQSKWMKNLLILDISSSQLNDDCAFALAESPYLNPRHSFNLSGNKFSPKAIDALKKRFKHINV
jgi:uncharacterized protein (TIGR02996 family)